MPEAPDEVEKLVKIIIEVVGSEDTKKEMEEFFKTHEEGMEGLQKSMKEGQPIVVNFYNRWKESVRTGTVEAEAALPRIEQFLIRWKYQLMLLTGAITTLWGLTKYSSVMSTYTTLLGRTIGVLADIILIRLLPAVMWLLGGLIWLIEKFEELPDWVKDVIAWVILLAGAFLFLKGTGILSWLGLLIPAFQQLLYAWNVATLTEMGGFGLAAGLAWAAAFLTGLAIGLAGVYILYKTGVLDVIYKAGQETSNWLMNKGGEFGAWLMNLGASFGDWVDMRIYEIRMAFFNFIEDVKAGIQTLQNLLSPEKWAEAAKSLSEGKTWGEIWEGTFKEEGATYGETKPTPRPRYEPKTTYTGIDWSTWYAPEMYPGIPETAPGWIKPEEMWFRSGAAPTAPTGGTVEEQAAAAMGMTPEEWRTMYDQLIAGGPGGAAPPVTAGAKPPAAAGGTETVEDLYAWMQTGKRTYIEVPKAGEAAAAQKVIKIDNITISGEWKDEEELYRKFVERLNQDTSRVSI